MTLGEAIKRLRSAAGWSQKTFAERVGVSASYLSLIEKDRREPTLSLVRDMARELGVPASILFAAALGQEAEATEHGEKLSKMLADLVEAASLNIIQTSLNLSGSA